MKPGLTIAAEDAADIEIISAQLQDARSPASAISSICPK